MKIFVLLVSMIPCLTTKICSLMLFENMMFSKSIREVTKFCDQRTNFPQMTSWRTFLYIYHEYVSLINSKPRLNFSKFKFIRGMELELCMTVKLLEDTQAADIPTSGPVVITISSKKRKNDSPQHGKPRADCCSRVVNGLLQLVHKCIFNIVFAVRR